MESTKVLFTRWIYRVVNDIDGRQIARRKGLVNDMNVFPEEIRNPIEIENGYIDYDTKIIDDNLFVMTVCYRHRYSFDDWAKRVCEATQTQIEFDHKNGWYEFRLIYQG